MSLNYTSPFAERVFAQLLNGNLLTIPNNAGVLHNPERNTSGSSKTLCG